MKKINKLFLLGTVLLTTSIFADDDIWFISPQHGQNVEKSLQIQIQPPIQQVPVTVEIEYDMGRDQLVWRGQLTTKNNYTTTVDISKFKPGKYEVKAEYYIQGRDFDGDVEIWIGGTSDSNGQYFPQQ